MCTVQAWGCGIVDSVRLLLTKNSSPPSTTVPEQYTREKSTTSTAKKYMRGKRTKDAGERGEERREEERRGEKRRRERGVIEAMHMHSTG